MPFHLSSDSACFSPFRGLSAMDLVAIPGTGAQTYKNVRSMAREADGKRLTFVDQTT